MYDPTIGRWLSEDPIGFEGGDANLYRYVGNQPTQHTDPSGLFQVQPGWNSEQGAPTDPIFGPPPQLVVPPLLLQTQNQGPPLIAPPSQNLGPIPPSQGPPGTGAQPPCCTIGNTPTIDQRSPPLPPETIPPRLLRDPSTGSGGTLAELGELAEQGKPILNRLIRGRPYVVPRSSQIFPGATVGRVVDPLRRNLGVEVEF